MKSKEVLSWRTRMFLLGEVTLLLLTGCLGEAPELVVAVPTAITRELSLEDGNCESLRGTGKMVVEGNFSPSGLRFNACVDPGFGATSARPVFLGYCMNSELAECGVPYLVDPNGYFGGEISGFSDQSYLSRFEVFSGFGEMGYCDITNFELVDEKTSRIRIDAECSKNLVPGSDS